MMRKIDHFIEKNHTVLEHIFHNQSLQICTPIFLMINKAAFFFTYGDDECQGGWQCHFEH